MYTTFFRQPCPQWCCAIAEGGTDERRRWLTLAGESGLGPTLSLRSYAFDRLSASVAVIDSRGDILDTNEAWRLFTHLNGGSTQATGRGVNYLSVCDHAAAAGVSGAGAVAEGLRQILNGDREHFESEYPCPSMIEDRWFVVHASSAPVDAGAGAVIFHIDVTARKLMTDRLLELAETDLLTGLPNRRVAIRFIGERLAQSHSTGKPVSVLFFDIDHFKEVNDRYGHHAGDELLAKVAARASRAVREQDRLCRFGGDEFVLACPSLSSGQAMVLADRLRAVMSEPFQIGASEVSTGVSVGVASSEPDSTVDSMLQAADAEMYRDKRRPSRRSQAPKSLAATVDRASAFTGLAHTRMTHTSPDSRIVMVGVTVVFASAAALVLIGAATSEEVVGRDIFDFVAPRSVTATVARQDSARHGVWPRPELITLRGADGTDRTVEWTSTPVLWHGQAASQVTMWETPAPHDQIRRHALGLRTEVADAVIVTDLDSRIQSFNRAAAALYGWAGIDVIGRPLNSLNRWIGSEAERSTADAQLQANGRWHGELSIQRVDGSCIELLGSTTLVRDDSGTAVGAVIVNRPVTGDFHASKDSPTDGALMAEIPRALANKEFVVYYQPLVRLSDSLVVGVEALVRWQHPERGLLSPRDFIEAAERSGHIVELGQHVLETACRQAHSWYRAGNDLRLAVNLSSIQLLDDRFPDRLAATLATTGLAADKLWLEITETTLVRDLERATRSLHRIRDLGVSISIDDFGTGWASLTYLRQFPVNCLKIDRLFVSGLGVRTRDAAIAHSIVVLADELGIDVVAEGVETSEQATMLQEIGCHYGQGFLFGYPEPAQSVVPPSETRTDLPGIGI